MACSLPIYILSGLILNVKDFDDLKNIVIQPNKAFILSCITLVIGFLIGFLFRLYRNWKGYVPYDTWTSVLNAHARGDWVLIHTSDGQEYEGIIRYFSIEDEPRELSIIKPIRVIRDNNLNQDETKSFFMGEEIFFSEKDIKRIVFLQEESIEENENTISRGNSSENNIDEKEDDFIWKAIILFFSTALSFSISIANTKSEIFSPGDFFNRFVLGIQSIEKPRAISTIL